VRFELLTSTPLSPTEGSGTFVAIDGLARGLGKLGHGVAVRPLGARTGIHTLDRWLYNVGVALAPPAADVVVGVDLDGFLWARRRARPRFVVMLKGIIADELRNERGVVRALLTVQARWERRNTERADRVIVASRYSAAVAGEVYGIPPEKLAVVPEPIDLAEWRRRFAAAPERECIDPGVQFETQAMSLINCECKRIPTRIFAKRVCEEIGPWFNGRTVECVTVPADLKDDHVHPCSPGLLKDGPDAGFGSFGVRPQPFGCVFKPGHPHAARLMFAGKHLSAAAGHDQRCREQDDDTQSME